MPRPGSGADALCFSDERVILCTRIGDGSVKRRPSIGHDQFSMIYSFQRTAVNIYIYTQINKNNLKLKYVDKKFDDRLKALLFQERCNSSVMP